MHATGGPGIIPFELAGTEPRATQIITTWGPPGVSAARSSLWLDFGYMSTYGTFTLLLSEQARRRHHRPAHGALGYLIPAACLTAVAADAREGVALLHVLHNQDRRTHAPQARRAALVKFSALTAVLAYWAASHLHLHSTDLPHA
ncbi:hypothetical protein [Williamsia muralis]|uniref:hypothetical protein n=1 Tax=Williamsia marianensis TaxID=85044 RepID=UPI00382E2B06